MTMSAPQKGDTSPQSVASARRGDDRPGGRGWKAREVGDHRAPLNRSTPPTSELDRTVVPSTRRARQSPCDAVWRDFRAGSTIGRSCSTRGSTAIRPPRVDSPRRGPATVRSSPTPLELIPPGRERVPPRRRPERHVPDTCRKVEHNTDHDYTFRDNFRPCCVSAPRPSALHRRQFATRGRAATTHATECRSFKVLTCGDDPEVSIGRESRTARRRTGSRLTACHTRTHSTRWVARTASLSASARRGRCPSDSGSRYTHPVGVARYPAPTTGLAPPVLGERRTCQSFLPR